MGKRPDQYQIDKGEGGATDYKNLPQTGRGHSDVDDTVEHDRQNLSQSLKDAQGQPIPPDVPAPSVHVKHGKKETQVENETEAHGGEGDKHE